MPYISDRIEEKGCLCRKLPVGKCCPVEPTLNDNSTNDFSVLDLIQSSTRQSHCNKSNSSLSLCT